MSATIWRAVTSDRAVTFKTVLKEHAVLPSMNINILIDTLSLLFPLLGPYGSPWPPRPLRSPCKYSHHTFNYELGVIIIADNSLAPVLSLCKRENMNHDRIS